MMQVIQDGKIKAEEETRIRQEQIAVKFEKIGQWKKEYNARVEKKRQEAEAARIKKARMIEEVRRIVGYNIDPKDEKFQLAMEQKEKEQQKKEKEAKKALKAAKLMEGILAKAKATETEKPPQSN